MLKIIFEDEIKFWTLFNHKPSTIEDPWEPGFYLNKNIIIIFISNKNIFKL